MSEDRCMEYLKYEATCTQYSEENNTGLAPNKSGWLATEPAGNID